MGGTPRFDVYSVARPSILHRSTSGRSISLRVETSAQRLRLQFSRILRDNGILVEKHARLARKSTPKPIRRNPVETSPLRAAFTSKEVGLYVVSRLIRRFRWPREVHTVTRHVAAANAPNVQSNHDEKFGDAHEFASSEIRYRLTSTDYTRGKRRIDRYSITLSPVERHGAEDIAFETYTA